MSIFSANGVNVYVLIDGSGGDERLAVDRGTLRLYSNGNMQVIDRENKLICSISMQALTHMNEKIVKSSGGTVEKGRTKLFMQDQVPVIVGRFATNTVILRMDTANHRTFNDICRRSGVPFM